MKTLCPTGKIRIPVAVFFTGCLGLSGIAAAQLPVKGVYATRYSATAGSNYIDTISTGSGLSGKYTYKFGTQAVGSNNYQRLDTFTIARTATATSTFVYSNTALPVVKIRRANNMWVTGLRKAIWFESDGNTPSSTVAVGIRAEYTDSLEWLFTKRWFNAGVDNAFENGATTGAATNNNDIERIDVIFRPGVKAINPDSAGFAIFDRGTAGGNDSFMIAAIKSLDANGDPADYYPAVRVGPLNYGSATGTAINFHALRKDDAEPRLRLFIAAVNQEREGVFFSFRSLGFPYSSTTSSNAIYGYSVMAPDVNRAAPGTPKNMVFYNNAAIFPTTTELGSVGGIDMVAVTGVAATLSTAAMLVLPVVINRFEASQAGDKVKVSWDMDPGSELSEASVEKSCNGTDFFLLGNKMPHPAAGIQEILDEHPLEGANYYRLRMVDIGGDIQYSSVAKVTMNAARAMPALMTIYPIPVTNHQFTLRTTGLGDDPYTLEMTDANGQSILRKMFPGTQLASTQVRMPLQTLAGVYTVRILDAGGTVRLVKRLLVQ